MTMSARGPPTAAAKGRGDFSRVSSDLKPFCVPSASSSSSMGSAMLVMDTGWIGPNLSVSTACSRRNLCILSAVNQTKADVIWTGRSEAAIIPMGTAEDGVRKRRRAQQTKDDSWSRLMSGYMNLGQYREVLRVYVEMRVEVVEVTTDTILVALKACGSLGDLEAGKEIHAHMVQSRDEFPVFVTNSLMDMYVKCGSLVDARRVFDSMPRRSLVSWSVMILGYARMEKGELALELYSQMRQAGLTLNDRTFVAALKACSSLAAQEEGTKVDGKLVKAVSLGKGRAIHSQLAKSVFESDVHVGTTLLDMYMKCGGLLDAQHVFDKLAHRNVVSWNVVILGYAEKQEGEVALQLYARMQQEAVAPNRRTFVGTCKACGSLAAVEDGAKVGGRRVKAGSLEKGRAIHSQAVMCGFESDVFVGATLVDMYVKCGSMEDARHVFDTLPQRNVVSWTTMILGHADKEEEGEVALRLYAQMLGEGVAPTDRTFVGTLKACSKLAAQEVDKETDGKVVKIGCLEKGRAIHSEVVRGGYESDVFVGTALVDMYVKCGSIVDARRAFDKLPRRDLVSWNAMILGYAEQQQRGSSSQEAFKLYSQMQHHGCSPDSWTFVSVLKACGNTAALEAGKEIHAQIRRAGLESSSIVATSLVDMYGKCGSMVDARALFDASHATRGLLMWNALISGYARQGESASVFQLFDGMKEEGLQPDGVTFLSILAVCSHGGLLDEGEMYFEAMSEEYNVTPSIEHYNCIVDLLGRAGRVDKAFAILKTMPIQPNLVAWRTMLGACRKWNNVEVGKYAFEQAVRLDKKHAAAYVLMSNIYANANMWEERDKIQAMRKKSWAWKTPGQSWWTDDKGIVHTFVVGGATHPWTNDINTKLKDLLVKMEEQGYMPNLNSVSWDISDDEKVDALCGHSEKLAIAYALLKTSPGTPIRVVKNLRVCEDCHEATAFISKVEERNIICRDSTRFHDFKDGKCSCGDYW